MKTSKYYGIIIISSIIISSVLGNVVYADSYNTLKSAHFHVYYPVDLEKNQAVKVLFWAEGAYKKLRTIFPYDLDLVHIHIHNKIDTPNGSAVSILFNKIDVYLAEAPYDSPIGAKNWLQNLLAHELTHIFTLDASRGYSHVLRNIFGKPLLPFTTPNYTTPLWFHEGTAVFNESLYAEGGRLNNSLYDAYYRKNAIFNDFPHISRLNTYYSNDSYPFGSTVYIYGAGLVYTIYDYMKKENPVGYMSTIHAGRFYYFFNYGLDTVLKNKDASAKEMSYVDMYQYFQKAETKRQLEKLALLKQIPLSKPKILYQNTYTIPQNATLATKTQTLYFTAYSPSDRKALYSYNVPTGKTTLIFKNSGLGDHVAIDSTETMLFFHIYKQNNATIYAIPYRLNLKTYRQEPISNKLERLLNPTPSPGGTKIAGIQLDLQGNNHLALYDISTSSIRILMQNTKAINPVFIDNSALAVFIYNFADNKTECIKVNINTAEKIPLFTIKGKVTTPLYAQDKIYMSCDKNGVYNIYSYDLTSRKIELHTHLDTAGYSPGILNKKLYFLYLRQYGNSISSLPLQKIDAKELPDITGQRLIVDAIKPNEIAYTQDNNYCGLSYLALHGWMPYFYSDLTNNYTGALTAWTDPLYMHQLLLVGQYDISNKDPQYYFYYSYLTEKGFLAQLSAQKKLTVYNKHSLPTDQDYSYYQHEYLNSIFTGYSLNTLDFSLILKAGWVYNHWLKKSKDPLDQLDYYEGPLYGPKASLSFYNRDYHITSLRPTNGIYTNCFYGYYPEPGIHELGADLFISIGAILFNNDILTSKNIVRGTAGEKVPQGYYILGGMPLLFTESQASLRGYATGYLMGYNYYMGNIEYSIPLFYLFQGWGTKPIFLKAAYLTLFYDYAQLPEHGFRYLHFNKFITSYGTELGFASLLIYHVPVDLVFGFAHAHHTRENSCYFSIKIPLGEQISFLDKHIQNKFYNAKTY